MQFSECVWINLVYVDLFNLHFINIKSNVKIEQLR